MNAELAQMRELLDRMEHQAADDERGLVWGDSWWDGDDNPNAWVDNAYMTEYEFASLALSCPDRFGQQYRDQQRWMRSVGLEPLQPPLPARNPAGDQPAGSVAE